MQWLFCRHADCGKPYESHAGQRPALCPSCEKRAAWSTEQGTGIIPVDTWELSYNDKRLLRSHSRLCGELIARFS